jgi:hypothetical protein
MKLYRKKLESVEALKREKIRLRYERRHTKTSDLNPLSEMGHGKVSRSAKDGIVGTVMELFTASNNLQMAFAVAKPILRAMGKSRRKKQAMWEGYGQPRKKKKSFLKRFVVEVAVGYIIGKAIQMTVLGAKMLLKRRKEAKLKSKLQGLH